MTAWADRLDRAGLLLAVAGAAAGWPLAGLAVLLAAQALRLATAPRTFWARSPLDPPLAAFVAVFLVEGALGPYPRVALGALAQVALAALLAYAPAARQTARDPAFLRPLLLAWAAGTVVAAGVGLGLAAIRPSEALRLGLGLNSAGTALAMGALALSGLGRVDGERGRGMAVAGIPAALLGLVVTGSRGAAAAWVVGRVALEWLSRGIGRRALIAAAVAAVLAAVVLAARPPLAAAALGPLWNRLEIWADAIDAVRRSPLAGFGLGTYRFATAVGPPELRVPGRYFTAHNLLLNTAVEGGLVGLAALVWLVAAALALGVREARLQTGTRRVETATVAAAFAALLAHQTVDVTILSFVVGTLLWAVLGVLAGGSR